MTHKKRSPGIIRICLLFAIALTLAVPASAEWKEKVLYSFQGAPDGAVPAGGVVFDKAGNLYGATLGGGASTCDGPGQCGTVYKLAPPATKGGAWTETVLYVFKGHAQNDGATPEGGLVIDEAGNLYGTTGYGGSGPCLLLGGAVGCGTVYELSPPAKQGDPWTETVLHSFQGGKDGYVASGDLVFDTAGNLYGATLFGGGKGTTCDSLYGGQCGTVFKLSPPKTKGGKWTEKVLHSFAGATDGAQPNGGLVLDGKGNVYGTTYAGGREDWGTVFALGPPNRKGGAWTEKQLHVFTTGNAGGLPSAGVIFDLNGNLYGTTLGTLFRLAPPSKKSDHWERTTLYAFCNQGGGGCEPEGSLILDSSGRLYGTTYYGFGEELYGSVFRLRAPAKEGEAWVVDYLYGFLSAPDGLYPAAQLVFDKAGNLYSTTTGGGRGTCSRYCGTVFEVKP
jgi:uncharacterized repeat protein (TIGR03803 family)